jgi:hypothetical protein
MNSCACLLAVLALPLLAVAQEEAAPAAERGADAPAEQTTRGASPFSMASPQVRQVLREAVARSQSDATGATPAAAPDVSPPRDPGLAPLRFRAPRRPHHVKCNGDDCTVYAADGTALYEVTNDGTFRDDAWSSGDYYDAWLSCQSTNNLLTTFERFDKCRGITIGLASPWNRDVRIALPTLAPK